MQDTAEKYTLNIPDSDKPRVVIIGGGFGGINLVKRLKSSLFQVVLLDRYNYHTFQPLLYQVATAGLEPDSIAGPLRKLIRNKKDFYFRMLMVHGIDPENRLVMTLAGALEYDILVIATGSRINYFGQEDIAEYALPLKQVTHALDMRSKIFQQFEEMELLREEEKKFYNIVVVGGGPTGIEVCGALSELRNHVLPKDYPELNLERLQIYLVEGHGRVLPEMSEFAGRKAGKYLEKLGVRLLLNLRTESYDGTTVRLSNGEEIQAGTLIWAAGVRGNIIEGLSEMSLSKDRIRVDGFNRVSRNIFAIGDVAHMETEEYPGGLPGLAPVAIQQGTRLARNLNRERQGGNMKPFRYLNKGVMATVGRNRAVADLPGGLRLGGVAGWMVWMLLHLLYLVGFRNKMVVFANWIWNYITYDRGIRLIIRPVKQESDPISMEIIKEINQK